MNKVELHKILGGAVQEEFSKSFEKVIENMQDINTPYKTARKLTITLSFAQNESRDDVKCDVSVVEKLAPRSPMATSFSVGKDLKTGKVFAEEYGKQIKGQMNISDYDDEEETSEKVIDFRKAK